MARWNASSPPNKKAGVNRRYVALLLVFFLTVYGCLQIVSPFFFLRDDNSTYFLPVYVHNYRVLTTEWELAEVNHHQYQGLPHLASSQPATLYPPIYVAVGIATALGDLRLTIEILALFHLAVAAVAMYWLGRHCNLQPIHCALLGAVWATLPFNLIVARSWIFATYLAAYLPLNLWLFLRFAKRPFDLTRLISFAVVKAAFLTTGYVQYFLFSSLFEAVFLGLRWSRFLLQKGTRVRVKRELLGMIGCTVIVYGFTAPLVLPILQAKALSRDRAKPLPIEETLNNSMRWVEFGSVQFLSTTPLEIHHTSSAIFFIGIPILFASFCLLLATAWRCAKGSYAFLKRRSDYHSTQQSTTSSVAIPCAIAGFVALLLSTDAYGLLCASELMATFRWPFKSIVFAAFYMVLASAIVWQRFKRPVDWAIAGFVVTLICHCQLLTVEDNRHGFSKFQLSCTSDELAQTLPYRLAKGNKRIATIAPAEEDSEAYDYNRQFGHWSCCFNYATLMGKYHLAGYDPIVPTRQALAALGQNWVSQVANTLDQAIVDHLAAQSVRWLTVPVGSDNEEQLKSLEHIEFRGREAGIAVYEILTAAPLASLTDLGTGESHELKVGISGNRIEIDTEGREGIVTINWVYHPAYHVEANGRRLGNPVETRDRKMSFAVNSEYNHVTVRFASVLVASGFHTAQVTLMLVGFLLLLKDVRRLRIVGALQKQRVPAEFYVATQSPTVTRSSGS